MGFQKGICYLKRLVFCEHVFKMCAAVGNCTSLSCLNMCNFVYAVCDFLGEKIASVLGISTPKYQYAIDEYYRMKKEVCHSVHFVNIGIINMLT